MKLYDSFLSRFLDLHLALLELSSPLWDKGLWKMSKAALELRAALFEARDSPTCWEWASWEGCDATEDLTSA